MHNYKSPEIAVAHAKLKANLFQFEEIQKKHNPAFSLKDGFVAAFIQGTDIKETMEVLTNIVECSDFLGMDADMFKKLLRVTQVYQTYNTDSNPHSPEPWNLGRLMPEKSLGIFDAANGLASGDHCTALLKMCENANETEMDIANAKRIVVCVNAMAGLTNGEVYAMRSNYELIGEALDWLVDALPPEAHKLAETNEDFKKALLNAVKVFEAMNASR